VGLVAGAGRDEPLPGRARELGEVVDLLVLAGVVGGDRPVGVHDADRSQQVVAGVRAQRAVLAAHDLAGGVVVEGAHGGSAVARVDLHAAVRVEHVRLFN
jgi:hypothetical protein